MPGTKIPTGLTEPAGLHVKFIPGKNIEADLAPKGTVPAQRTSVIAKQHISTASVSPFPVTQAPAVLDPAIPGALQMIPARELFVNTASALGFPPDTLSTTLLAFMRFFSLPPAFLGLLRRETLSTLKSSSPQDQKEKVLLEGKAMAVSAALDKGLKLSPAALNRYAAYLIPPATEKSDKTLPDRKEIPGQNELQALTKEESNQDDFLDFLNTLPGKNGQKWIVYPFSIKLEGKEFNIVLRILTKAGPGENDCMIADITGQKRQWRCIIRKTGNALKADIKVSPGLSLRTQKLLSGEAKRILEGFDEILIKNSEELPSWTEDLFNEPLPLLNKEV